MLRSNTYAWMKRNVFYPTEPWGLLDTESYSAAAEILLCYAASNRYHVPEND